MKATTASAPAAAAAARTSGCQVSAECCCELLCVCRLLCREHAGPAATACHAVTGRGGARQHHLRQGGAVATGQDHQQQQQQQVRQPQRPLSTGRQRPQMHRQQQQHPAPQQPRCVSAGRQRAATPSSYPACGGQRLQQLAQPKVANRDKYEQVCVCVCVSAYVTVCSCAHSLGVEPGGCV